MNFHEKLMAKQSAMSIARLGFDHTKVDQGSPEWHTSRLGVITASRAKDLIASGRGGKGYGAARDTYLLELIAEVATGKAAEMGEFKQTQWGHEWEGSAREIFAFEVGAPVIQTPFLYANENMRHGCSPDGLADEQSGIEIKCPFTTKVYIDFLINEEIKPEYIEQVQFSMFVTGMQFWHFANFDPRMKVKPFHCVTIERDEEKMRIFEDAVGAMVHDMDSALAKIGMRFGDQWQEPLKEAA